MDITTAILCDFAQVRDRLLFISSGAVTRIYRPELPADLGIMLGMVVEIPRHDAGMPHNLLVRVVNRHGAELASIRSTIQVGDQGLFPNEVQQVPVALNLARVPIRTWGTHQVRILIDGEQVRTLTAYVVPSGGVVTSRPPAVTPSAIPPPPADASGDGDAAPAAEPEPEPEPAPVDEPAPLEDVEPLSDDAHTDLEAVEDGAADETAPEEAPAEVEAPAGSLTAAFALGDALDDATPSRDQTDEEGEAPPDLPEGADQVAPATDAEPVGGDDDADTAAAIPDPEPLAEGEAETSDGYPDAGDGAEGDTGSGRRSWRRRR